MRYEYTDMLAIGAEKMTKKVSQDCLTLRQFLRKDVKNK
jgi:hypothetical protein